LTLADLTSGWGGGELRKLRVIADIACDIDGAIEATVKATTPDNPVYVYDVANGHVVDGLAGSGPVILAVDNLPAELPREASRDFGDTLVELVPPLDGCDWTGPIESLGLPAELSRAIIAHRGDLAPRFEYLREFLDARTSA
jgi:alpha-aminoadipic semialdehyde synthase